MARSSGSRADQEYFGERIGLFVALVLLALSCLLTGCASRKVSRYNYGRLAPLAPIAGVIVAHPDAVDRHCRRKAKVDDLGRPLTPNDGRRARACWIPSKRMMVVARGDLDSFIHELCHVDQIAPALCDRFHSEEFYEEFGGEIP